MEIGRGAGEGGPIQIEQCSCMQSLWILEGGQGKGVQYRLSSAPVCIIYKIGSWGQGRGCNTSLLSSSAFLAQFLKAHIKLVFGGRGFNKMKGDTVKISE